MVPRTSYSTPHRASLHPAGGELKVRGPLPPSVGQVRSFEEGRGNELRGVNCFPVRGGRATTSSVGGLSGSGTTLSFSGAPTWKHRAFH